MKNQYQPKGKYMWDTWFAIDDKGVYHAFYLQSELGDTRYAKTSIGHAKSSDLKVWQEVGTAIEPGPKGEWDDLALWTGSVYQHEGKWYMFYTGRNHNNKWAQAIGLAISSDLNNWQKVDGPISEPIDARYSRQQGFNEINNPPAWRDPFVFFDKKSGKFQMLISARANDGSTSFNGCIGRATSDDLINWQTEEPILANKAFDEMEVPQMIVENSRYYLLFSYRKSHNIGSKPKLSSGLYCFVSDNIEGGYKPVKGWYGQIMKYHDKYYGMRLLKKVSKNNYSVIGWSHLKSGKFVGKMSATYNLRLEPSKLDLTKVGVKIIDSIANKLR